MKFLIDNALSPIIVNGLVKSKHDAIHVRDLGMATASDPEILEFAAIQGRVLISADTDFGTLLAYKKLTKPSFILFRQTDKRPVSQLNALQNHLPEIEKIY